MGAFGGAEKMKDTRPLHDKSYVQQCIKQLHEVQKKINKDKIMLIHLIGNFHRSFPPVLD